MLKDNGVGGRAGKQEAGVKRECKSVIVDDELDKIYKKYKKLDAETVLKAATPTSNPLHPYFDWNDTAAAKKWRLQQATNMLLASKMVVLLSDADKKGLPNATKSRPVEVRRIINSFRGKGFKMRKEVLDEAASRKALIERKISTLRGWCDEACDIEELAKIRKGILQLLP